MGTSRSDKVQALRRELRDRGFAVVRVAGGCMTPALREGESVLVDATRSPRRGDVALIDAGGTLELHRVLERSGSGRGLRWLHAGDAGEACGTAGPGEVLGTARSARGPGYRARWRGLLFRLRGLFRLLGAV
jgi:hypothetical protein